MLNVCYRLSTLGCKICCATVQLWYDELVFILSIRVPCLSGNLFWETFVYTLLYHSFLWKILTLIADLTEIVMTFLVLSFAASSTPAMPILIFFSLDLIPLQGYWKHLFVIKYYLLMVISLPFFKSRWQVMNVNQCKRMVKHLKVVQQ